jgi:hypothetical protein
MSAMSVVSAASPASREYTAWNPRARTRRTCRVGSPLGPIPVGRGVYASLTSTVLDLLSLRAQAATGRTRATARTQDRYADRHEAERGLGLGLLSGLIMFGGVLIEGVGL